MKYSALAFCLFCIAVTANAQETQRAQLPPMRNTDNVRPALQNAAPVVPVLNAGKGQPALQKATPVVPIQNATNASAAKTATDIQVVPIRKSDIANGAQPAALGTKATENKLSVPDSLQPPSFISAQQALELRQKRDAVKKPLQ
ncbi:MAG: hypothetical protein JST39_18885 [Bacteroidetes bacterium]|nr:hypothetical protein [Bacteroidota bacterium]